MNAAEKAKFTRLKRDISAGIDDLAKGLLKRMTILTVCDWQMRSDAQAEHALKHYV